MKRADRPNATCRHCGVGIHLDRRGVWRHTYNDALGCRSYSVAEPDDQKCPAGFAACDCCEQRADKCRCTTCNMDQNDQEGQDA